MTRAPSWLARRLLVGTWCAGATAFVVAACDDFSAASANDAGVAPRDAASAFDADAGSDAAADGGAPQPFCASLPAIADGGARVCDDFDQDPDGGGTFVGWRQAFEPGTRGSYGTGLSLPFSYRVEVDKGRAFSQGTMARSVASGRAFRVSFQIRGKQPVNSGVTLAALDLGNPGYTAFLALYAPPNADRVVVEQRRFGSDGGYIMGNRLSVPDSPGIVANAWTPVVIDIDGATIAVKVGPHSGRAALLAPQVGATALMLTLGAIAPSTALAEAVDISYDNVVIESFP